MPGKAGMVCRTASGMVGQCPIGLVAQQIAHGIDMPVGRCAHQRRATGSVSAIDWHPGLQRPPHARHIATAGCGQQARCVLCRQGWRHGLARGWRFGPLCHWR